jgi:hypothetical protein
MGVAVFLRSDHDRPSSDINQIIHLGVIMKKLVMMDERDLAIIRAQIDPEYAEYLRQCEVEARESRLHARAGDIKALLDHGLIDAETANRLSENDEPLPEEALQRLRDELKEFRPWTSRPWANMPAS